MSWLSKDELLLEQYICSDCAWYGEGEGGQRGSKGTGTRGRWWRPSSRWSVRRMFWRLIGFPQMLNHPDSSPKLLIDQSFLKSKINDFQHYTLLKIFNSRIFVVVDILALSGWATLDSKTSIRALRTLFRYLIIEETWSHHKKSDCAVCIFRFCFLDFVLGFSISDLAF